MTKCEKHSHIIPVKGDFPKKQKPQPIEISTDCDSIVFRQENSADYTAKALSTRAFLHEYYTIKVLILQSTNLSDSRKDSTPLITTFTSSSSQFLSVVLSIFIYA